MQLRSSETELVGSWTQAKDNIVKDQTCNRIEFLTTTCLDLVGTSPDGWDKLYIDRGDGRYWELIFPNSDAHGGGPPTLRNLSIFQVREKYELGDQMTPTAKTPDFFMENQFIDSLEGRSFKGSVGEPWNFVSDAGDNVLKGSILEVQDDCLLLKIVPFQTEEDTKIEQVIAYNRYVGNQKVVQELAAGRTAIVHFCFRTDGVKIQWSDLQDHDEGCPWISWLIGGIDEVY